MSRDRRQHPAFLGWDASDVPTEWPETLYGVSMWHMGECQLCGSEDYTLVDHDHVTHLTRGMLCRSCNRREGLGLGGMFEQWRSGCNPGQMFGLAETYWTAFTWGEGLPVASADTMRRGAEAAGRIG